MCEELSMYLKDVGHPKTCVCPTQVQDFGNFLVNLLSLDGQTR